MPEISSSRYLVTAGWDDVPHLDDKAKAELLSSTAPHLRDARSKGIPSLGAGAIYPVPLEDVTSKPFKIPDYWPRAYGLDVGWNKTAALWGAWDRDHDTIYINSEHYRGEAEPPIHATAIKARGDWVPGLIDPAARGRGQAGGEQMLQQYLDLGLKLTVANNAVDAGLDAVWVRLATGRLKIFETCQNTLAEYRIYRRDPNGKIIKKFDHLMDALRYLIMGMTTTARVRPANQAQQIVTSGRGDSLVNY